VLAIIANASAIALVLRSRRDEWIIALPGCFNISAHQQSGRHRARDIGLGISSKLRRHRARHMMKSWCQAGATLRDAGRLERERGARRRGGSDDGWRVVSQFESQQWVDTVEKLNSLPRSQFLRQQAGFTKKALRDCRKANLSVCDARSELVMATCGAIGPA
jgi:hypothetical protein